MKSKISEFCFIAFFTHKMCGGSGEVSTCVHLRVCRHMDAMWWTEDHRRCVAFLRGGDMSLRTRLAGPKPPGNRLSLPSHCAGIGITDSRCCAQLYVGPGDSNSGPYACRARCLSTQALSSAYKLVLDPKASQF